jgi:hypothetical protein
VTLQEDAISKRANTELVPWDVNQLSKKTLRMNISSHHLADIVDYFEC